MSYINSSSRRQVLRARQRAQRAKRKEELQAKAKASKSCEELCLGRLCFALLLLQAGLHVEITLARCCEVLRRLRHKQPCEAYGGRHEMAVCDLNPRFGLDSKLTQA